MCLFWPKEQRILAKENPRAQLAGTSRSHLFLPERAAYVRGWPHGQRERTAGPVVLSGLAGRVMPVALTSFSDSGRPWWDATLADLSVAQRFDWRAHSHWQEECASTLRCFGVLQKHPSGSEMCYSGVYAL